MVNQLSSLFASRDISSIDDVDYKLDKLISPDLLKSVKDASNLLISKIDSQSKLLLLEITMLMEQLQRMWISRLKKFGADVDFIVPNRFEFGYGLTPEIVDLAYKKKP